MKDWSTSWATPIVDAVENEDTRSGFVEFLLCSGYDLYFVRWSCFLQAFPYLYVPYDEDLPQDSAAGRNSLCLFQDMNILLFHVTNI